MTERKKTHLIYIDNTNHVWMQEYGVGAKHPENAQFYCEVPSNDSPNWIEGKPKIKNIQFLTLSPFFPSQRLDVSVEIYKETKFSNMANHPPFEGCVKYMPVSSLTFRSIPESI